MQTRVQRQQTYLLQFNVPVVKGNRPDLGDVHTKASVNPRALYTEHDAKVDTGPFWLLGATVSTLVISKDIKKVQTKRIT